MQTKHSAGKYYVWDTLRKKYIILTPEEWVRQHLINYLTVHLGYPLGLVSVEGTLKVYKTQKRTDVLVYNTSLKPVLLAECKAPNVDITQNVFDQIAVYNTQINAEILVITNGLRVFCCKSDTINKKWIFLNEIPLFAHLAIINKL